MVTFVRSWTATARTAVPVATNAKRVKCVATVNVQSIAPTNKPNAKVLVMTYKPTAITVASVITLARTVKFARAVSASFPVWLVKSFAIKSA